MIAPKIRFSAPFFLKNFATAPLFRPILFYGYALCLTTILAPLVFNGAVYWHQHWPSRLTHYLVHKNFTVFFERLRLISFLLFTPCLWKFYRRRVADQSFLFFSWGKFFYFFTIGSIFCGGIFLAKMLMQGFCWESADPLRSPKLLLPKLLSGAIVLSIIEEWLFRGLIFQIFLRCVRPFYAIIFSSLLFAYFHFRPNYTVSAQNTFVTLSDSFSCLAEILFHTFSNISLLKFSILFTFGCLLATIYFYVKNLSAPIGFHSGVVFALMYFKRYIFFPDSHYFFGANDILNSPFVLLATTIFTASIHRYFSHKTGN
ncbi:MAG: CPBP family intramembrane metalloprotease [Puniceicoccales bacterium]|jgi:membrane protease YdiL (CAAX protease family)|nr:CPBP family intramembrane metalloprotease [Puniceicoccales bacterium]